MVKYTANSMNRTLSALSDPTRRAIVERLAGGKHSVLQIAKPFEMSLPAVSKHLKVLEKAGLVKREVNGRVHTFNLVAEPMKNAIDWLNNYRVFWEGQFDSLTHYLNNEKEKE
ncbi:ArsR family transcriptional regulator [Candidatus Marinimicrobia bacterium MT.SAG.4]|nr:ArsR family transcriptional regulator [Candidatus Marinimicrobia bacterium MT.SAG.4]